MSASCSSSAASSACPASRSPALVSRGTARRRRAHGDTMRPADADPHAAGAQPGAARPPAAAGARPDAAAESARADRRDPGAVRAVDVHRAVVAARGLHARRRSRARSSAARSSRRRSCAHTIHLVSRADYWPLALAVRDARRARWRTAMRDAAAPQAMAGAARTLRGALTTARSPARRSRRCSAGRVRAASGCGSTSCASRRRARGSAAGPTSTRPPRTGSARRRSTTGAAEHLVRRYLAGFGPAARKDVVSFTGLPLKQVDAVLGRLELREFGGGLRRPPARAAPRPRHARAAALPADLGRDAARPRPPHAASCPRSTGRGSSASKTPHSFPTFLVDGRVAGTWRHEGGRIELAPFGRLDAADRRALNEEADRLAELHS